MFIKVSLLKLTVLCLILGNSTSVYEFAGYSFYSSGTGAQAGYEDRESKAYSLDRTLDIPSMLHLTSGENIDKRRKMDSNVLASHVNYTLANLFNRSSSKTFGKITLGRNLNQALTDYKEIIKSQAKDILNKKSLYNNNFNIAGAAITKSNNEKKLAIWKTGNNCVFLLEKVNTSSGRMYFQDRHRSKEETKRDSYADSKTVDTDSVFASSYQLTSQMNETQLKQNIFYKEYDLHKSDMVLALSKGVLFNVFSPILLLGINLAIGIASKVNDIYGEESLNESIEKLLIYFLIDYQNYMIENSVRIEYLFSSSRNLDTRSYEELPEIREYGRKKFNFHPKFRASNLIVHPQDTDNFYEEMQRQADHLNRKNEERQNKVKRDLHTYMRTIANLISQQDLDSNIQRESFFDLVDCNLPDYLYFDRGMNYYSYCITDLFYKLGVEHQFTNQNIAEIVGRSIKSFVKQFIQNNAGNREILTPIDLYGNQEFNPIGPQAYDFSASIGIISNYRDATDANGMVQNYHNLFLRDLVRGLPKNNRILI